MITAELPVPREEIAKAIQVPEDDTKAFYLMLRNHIRAKKRRIDRDGDGNYFVVKQSRRGPG